jgi:hypothetical protein
VYALSTHDNVVGPESANDDVMSGKATKRIVVSKKTARVARAAIVSVADDRVDVVGGAGTEGVSPS